SIDISRDRWIKETSLNLSGTVISGALFGGANAHQLLSIGNSAARAAGYRGVMQNEADYGQALIDTLEAQKIDTSKFPEEIKALTLAVQQVADSKPMQALLKDETRARALVEGHLRQRILASGLENCRLLNDYVKDEAIPSLDAFLDTFKAEDTRLHQALSNLCYGHANSNDISVILAESNGLRADDMPKHHRVLKAFVESTLKGSISHYMTRASQIDVIQDLRLIDVHTMTPDLTKTGAALVQTHAHATDTIRKDIDAQTRLAMTTLFATEFGVSHVGQYDVSRMFSFYLHRHGRHELISSELLDGKVGMENELKAVHVRTPSEIRGFVERTKMRARLDGSRSTEHMKEEQPHAGALFLRTCGYEYFLPQAVITSGRNNRLAENPEAPVAYPMVNKVLETFIERLSLSDIATYRQKIGEELDSLIAQSFIDFFKEVGTKHAEKFAEQRALLRDAYNNDNYSGRFDAYCDRITKDALGEFPLFMKIYERNLQKTLETAPDSEAVLLQKQIDALHDTAKDYLAPNVTRPGSFQDKERARTSDHRGENMTERWNFGS
ncbi:MAG: hypothetical protein C0436_05340, partial [Alphaproteobacteria bacterium]|nr:hypothetical protein [Alphaproteobacteria bacterium]